jgi:hypothetical protein
VDEPVSAIIAFGYFQTIMTPFFHATLDCGVFGIEMQNEQAERDQTHHHTQNYEILALFRIHRPIPALIPTIAL